MKESQRKAIWRADKLFTASSALSYLAVNDSNYSQQAYALESQAHKLIRAAGFPDKSTFELSAWCAQICEDYVAGNLEVLPFE